MRTRARIFSLVRSFIRSHARSLVCVGACAPPRIRTPTCIFACVPLYDSRDRYMQTLVPPPPLSRSVILPLFFFRTLFRFRPLPLNRSFFLFRSHPCAFSPSIPLLFPASRPPPLSTPSRIFYSFSLSLSPFRSFVPSFPPSLSSSMPSSHSTPFPPSLSPPNFFLCL